MNSQINKRFKKKMLVFCLGIILIAASAGCSQNSSSSATSQSSDVTPVVVADTVIAEGHLVPNTSTWLSFQTTGRVEEVLVDEGHAVKKDQPLVRLEGSDRAESELKAAQSDLFLAQQNLNDAKESGTLKASVELQLAKAQRKYNTALGNYWDRNLTQGSEEQIALYNANVTLAQNKIDDIQNLLDNMDELSDSDTAKVKTIAALNQAKIDLDNIKKLRDYYQDLPDNLDVEILTAELNIAKAQLEDAHRDYDRLKDGPSKESLAEIQAVADAAQAKADEAQWAYDQLVLKAPYDGVFVQCDLTVGEFVTVGQKVALVADFSQWMIETDDLDEIEAAEIDTSKPVSITADALPGREFSGMVERLSQYYTDKNGDILYTAKIKMNKATDSKLRWGMTVQVEFQK